jgi:hypothetical protein
MSTPDSAPIAAPRLVRSADVPPQPWRNGGGQTRVLLTCPPGANWRLRLSMADIQADGPFSVFEGVQRWLAVLDGAGVGLRIAGKSQHQTPDSPPLRFSGDSATDCWLTDGPTRDLNLMLRGCAGGLAAVVPGQAWPGDSAACGLFSTGSGQCTLRGRQLAVPPLSLLWFGQGPGPLTFASDDAGPTRAWWIWADLDLGPNP